MALAITEVGYRDFRSMHELALELGGGLTVLVGPNAVGKTNCIEGIQLLTSGVSFRRASPGELIRQGAERASLHMKVCGEKRCLDVGYDVFPSKKLLSINGKRRPGAEGRGVVPSILFYPDELLVVKGPAAGRRELIDAFGAQVNAAYAGILSDYRRALQQRNMLLRDAARTGAPLPEGLFEAWSDSLVNAGSMLYLYRTALLGRMSPHVARIYAELSRGEEAAVSYCCAYAPASTGDGGEPAGMRLEDLRGCGREDVAGWLRASLAKVRDQEVRRCQTLVGPHLDDVVFSVEGRPARSYASQGQQRSLVLAVKLAQVRLIHEMQGQYPVFLLDDVMSELDSQRRSRLFDLIRQGMQTVVTTTNLEYFRSAELGQAKVVRLDR